MTCTIRRRLERIEAAAGLADDRMNYPVRRFIIDADETGDSLDILRARGEDVSGSGWIVIRRLVRP